jgi:hypothetical protein
MELCMQTPLLSFLLNLVLSVGNIMLPIEDLMVNGRCIATTGGRRLFDIYIYMSVDLLKRRVATYTVGAVGSCRSLTAT